MNIKLTDLTEKIAAENYLEDSEIAKYSEVNKAKSKLYTLAQKMLQEISIAAKKEKLIHVELQITGQRPVTFALETNIINLPYSNYKKIVNFFDEDQEYPVNVYLETSSEWLNASHFRIDELCSVEDLLAKKEDFADQLGQAMSEKLQVVRNYEKPAAKEKVAKKVKKTAKKK